MRAKFYCYKSKSCYNTQENRSVVCMKNYFKNMKFSLTKKITLGFILVISLIGLIFLSWSSFYSDKRIKEDQINSATNCAKIASNMLYNAPLNEFLTKGKNNLYNEYRAQLLLICKNFNLRYLYVYIPDFEHNKLTAIFDMAGRPEDDTTKKVWQLGQVVNWKLSAAEKNAFYGIEDKTIVELNDQYGHVMSRYVPIYNNKNKIIAVLGVDFDYHEYKQKIVASFVKGLFFMGLCLLTIYLVLILYMKHIIVKPIVLISSRMNNFLKDNTTSIEPIEIESGDELEFMASSFNKMAADINSYIKQISDMQMETIFSLAKLAQSRDDDTGKHLDRVQQYCYVLAKKLSENSPYSDQIDDNFIKNTVNASILHDIGKVAISDLILLKPGKLTDEEFAEMKKHTSLGAQTLNEVDSKFGNNSFIQIGTLMANYHHERWDGRGYPQGLKGEEIPLAARIMAIADVYDAISTKRVYKDAFPQEKCIEIIKEGRGTQFDPVIVDAFLESTDIFNKIREEMSETVEQQEIVKS